MSSRSATLLVIFTVAIVAFCLASVFASMTGPISILPNKTNDSTILDNVSSFVENGNSGESYGYKSYDNHEDHSSSSSSDSSSSSSSSGSNVETTTDFGSSESSSSSSSSSSSHPGANTA